jgi:hypothetical protein
MNHRYVMRSAAALMLSAATAGEAMAQTVMQPGAWQMETSVSATNPATGETVKVGDTKMTLCLTPEFLAKQPYFNATLDEQAMKQKGAQCTTSGYARDGNTASWKMACALSDGKTVDMTVKTAAGAKSLKSELRQIVTQGNQATPVNITIAGTFAGECTPDMPRP